MNIVYASDDNFAEMLGISMISLFENNKKCNEIDVYILDGGISDKNKTLLKKISESYLRNLYFLNVNKYLDKKMKQQRGSLSTFSRLYLGDLLPDYVTKSLYLDCDLLILKNISEMYNTNIQDYYCAGVNDCISKERKQCINLKADSNYFNAGVLLINVSKWRETEIISKFISFSKEYNNDVDYADQGIINGVISHNSFVLPIEYNCYTAIYDFSYKDLLVFRKPSSYFSEKEVEVARKAPAIVHFTTSFLSLRPWIEGCKHPFACDWLKYKAMSPWADVPLRTDNRSAKKKLAVKLYKILPKKIALTITGLLHAKVIPILKNKK